MQRMALISFRQILITRQFGISKLHFVAYIELYRPLPGNFIHCRHPRYNLLLIDLSLPQKLARSSCDVADNFIMTVT